MSMMRDLRSVVRPSRRRLPLGGTPVIVRSEPPSAIVDCAVYADGARLPERFSPSEAVGRVRGSGEGFVWIGLHEPSEEELSGIAGLFDLHPLAVEDAVHAHQRPKLERYDGVLFTVFKTLSYVEPERCADPTASDEVVQTGEIMVFTGRDFVITVRHGGHGGLSDLRRGLEEDPELLAKGPSAVLHGVADQVVDGYLAVAGAVELDIDELEFSVFSEERPKKEAKRIYQLKREVLEFKRSVVPLQRPLERLAERPIRQVDPEVQTYFRDVADHLTRVTDQVTSFDDLLNSILQANLAQVTVSQNEDMRRISAWAAIFMVPTMLTGLYGMNFDVIPGSKLSYGFPLVAVVILGICWAMLRGFKRSGWL